MFNEKTLFFEKFYEIMEIVLFCSDLDHKSTYVHLFKKIFLCRR